MPPHGDGVGRPLFCLALCVASVAERVGAAEAAEDLLLQPSVNNPLLRSFGGCDGLAQGWLGAVSWSESSVAFYGLNTGLAWDRFTSVPFGFTSFDSLCFSCRCSL